MLNETQKEQAITNFIKSIEFEKYFDINEIKHNLKQIINEEPAVKLEWAVENSLNEVTGKNEGRIEKLYAVKIFYTSSNGNINQLQIYV